MRNIAIFKLGIVLSLLARAVEQTAIGNYKIKSEAKRYLIRYGYLKENAVEGKADTPDADFSRALIIMQRHAGIPETGKLDLRTTRKMEALQSTDSAASVNGENKIDFNSRPKRYIYSGLKWPNPNRITVRFLNYTDRFPVKDQDHVMASVVKEWNAACDNMNLVLLRQGSTGYADILISFDDYTTHGRKHRPGGQHAYTFYPTNGDIKADNTELWDARTLRVLLLHEIGHSLGLDHSRNRDAIMYRYLKFDQLTLGDDDIRGVQSVYCPEVLTPKPPVRHLEDVYRGCL